MVPSRGNARSGRDEFRETFERLSAHGNPEPSRRYTGGRCRDYLGARVPLMTGMSIPHPHAWALGLGTGEEIVHSWRKRRGTVNPLVVGSNPTGPTTLPQTSAVIRLSAQTARRGLLCPWTVDAVG